MSQIKGFLSPLLEKWRMEKAKIFVLRGNVLDIGCGEGRLLKFIDNSISRYVGIDNDEECIEKAKDDWKEKNYEFRHAFVTESLEIDNKFDNIVMLAIIEHMECPDKVLRKLTENLSENGRIIITTPGPLAQFIHNIGSKIGLFDKDAGEEHKVIFSKEELYKLADDIGLRVAHYSSFEFGLNNLIVMVK